MEHENLLQPHCAGSHIRVVHVLGSREGFQRPVEEAIDEDEASTTSPNQKDGDECHAQVIDYLQEQQMLTL